MAGKYKKKIRTKVLTHSMADTKGALSMFSLSPQRKAGNAGE